MVDDGGETGRALRVGTGEDVHLCVVNDAGLNGPRSVRAIGETRLQRIHNAMWAFGDQLVRFACVRA